MPFLPPLANSLATWCRCCWDGALPSHRRRGLCPKENAVWNSRSQWRGKEMEAEIPGGGLFISVIGSGAAGGGGERRLHPRPCGKCEFEKRLEKRRRDTLGHISLELGVLRPCTVSFLWSRDGSGGWSGLSWVPLPTNSSLGSPGLREELRHPQAQDSRDRDPGRTHSPCFPGLWVSSRPQPGLPGRAAPSPPRAAAAAAWPCPPPTWTVRARYGSPS